ncbi:MAG: hypothetical protein RIB93_12635 [Coleofasciculus sp. D1-CHI-01]
MYQAKAFFGVLYCLTDPDLYFLACETKGEDKETFDSAKALTTNE